MIDSYRITLNRKTTYDASRLVHLAACDTLRNDLTNLVGHECPLPLRRYRRSGLSLHSSGYLAASRRKNAAEKEKRKERDLLSERNKRPSRAELSREKVGETNRRTW